MTSPDPKADPKSTPNAPEGGGMLPALLAGAGILAVAALFIFGGDDKEAKQAKQDGSQQQANAQTQKLNSPNGGVASRKVDDATSAKPKPRLNPRIANAVVTEGMAPVPNKRPDPTSFESVEAEITYWEAELVEANRMLEVRQTASEHVPRQEARIRENGTPQDLEAFEGRKQVVANNLAKAQARVAEIEAKLAKLRGG